MSINKTWNYDPLTSIGKGADDAVTTAGSAGVSGIVTAVVIGLLRSKADIAIDEQTATVAIGAVTSIGAALVQGWKRWRRNRKKHGPKE